MKKKVYAVALSMALALTIGTGSVFADSKLDSVIHPTIGISYKTAGTTTNGFDCSGFTSYIFKELGVTLPRQSSSQYHMGDSVSRNEMRPGDLVFFNTFGEGVSHVGIFVGEGKFAHSSTSRGVIISSLNENYYAQRYVGAKRVMSTAKYQATAYN